MWPFRRKSEADRETAALEIEAQEPWFTDEALDAAAALAQDREAGST